MLDITGGDTAALGEITTTGEVILASSDPDLAAMGDLVVHRDVLAQRDSNIPTIRPAVGRRSAIPTSPKPSPAPSPTHTGRLGRWPA